MNRMIREIAIRNFKSIKELMMKCSALTLLIGNNSSGKSTIHQALLILAQNVGKTEGLNGSLVKLGSFEENRCCYVQDKEMGIAVLDEENDAINQKMVRVPEANQIKVTTKMKNIGSKEQSDKAPEASQVKSTKENERLIRKWNHVFDIKERNIQYLSCHRIGPENLYQKNMELEDVIGVNGEYAVSYLNNHGSELVPEKLRKGASDFTLLGQVNWWLKDIAGVEISLEEIQGADMVKASYRMGGRAKIRPVNIGSGVSYLLSILIMCLSAPEKGIIVIENPEIHLHPSAQSKVCSFLYFTAESGRQLFIESHSDHIFNGFCAGMAREEMDKEKISIQFVSLNDEYVTEAMQVEIGEYGNIRNQKKDLFDQFDIDMNKMIGL